MMPAPASLPTPQTDADRPLAELRRCPSCQRWGGVRRLAADGHKVELDPLHPRGPCLEGPWHGSLRGPRNACGQWLQWQAIGPAAGTDSGTATGTADPGRDAHTLEPPHSSSSSSGA